MISIQNLKYKSILVFGLGISGEATATKLINNKSKVKVWDDQLKPNQYKNFFFDSKYFLNQYDYIVISPGIDIFKHKKKEFFIKNKHKIITDIDIFISSLNLKKHKVIAITGTNGKSTFSKLIYDIVKLKYKNSYLLGNFGQPVLSHYISEKKSIYILELSSYQIENSKFLRTHLSAILNITPDHLDRHKTLKNYIKIKLSIFNSLVRGGKGFINIPTNNLDFINLNLKKKNKKIIKIKKKTIGLKINNNYLNNKNFNPSLNICFEILKKLKIPKKTIMLGIKYFKPLPHRQEFVKKINNIHFINDSKATNFDSAKFSLSSYENIFWIMGGLSKKRDQIILGKIKSKIIKTYIIGNECSFFKKKLKKCISFVIAKDLKKALSIAYNDAVSQNLKHAVILLSPGAASFDQFKNFEHRGEVFKKLVNKL